MTTLSARLHGFRPGRDDQEPVTQVVPEPPQETGGEPGPAPQPAAQEGTQMTVPGQFWATIRFAFRTARRRGKDIASAEGGWVNAALNGKPPSVNEQRSYLANRGWLEPGHEGGIADFLGEGYHVTYGIIGVGLGNFVSWLFSKPFHLAGAAVAFLVALFWTCELAGLPVALSGSIAGTLGILMLAPVGAAAGVLALRRAAGRWRADRRTATVTASHEEGD